MTAIPPLHTLIVPLAWPLIQLALLLAATAWALWSIQ